VKTVNALNMRNNLGEILQELEETGEPVLVSKGRKIRGALISIEDFQTRFIDKQAEDQKQNWLKKLNDLRAPRSGNLTSLDALRELRGYRS
jgi:PHD/YefM family antitoxin component YafN of YafNO toxin-antitoxin module